MKLAKRLSYKLIIILCILVTFCSFIASAPVYASKVNTSDFYYSGVQKGSYSVQKGFLAKLIESLGTILDYLLGLCTMGVRMVFIGWTAIFERCLTLILKSAAGEETIEVDGESATSLFSADGWVTLDAIFFNHVPLLDINFFNQEQIDGYNGDGSKKEAPMIVYTCEEDDIEDGIVEKKLIQGKKTDFKAPKKEEKKSLVVLLKETIAGWYYVLRLISIMVMLVLLMYIGIKMAITSSTTDKAVYKKMLTDWVVGMILVFTIHYIMLFIITLNETLVSTLEGLRTGSGEHPLAVYEYGLEERAKKPITNEELELTLYDEVKTRAYDVKMTVGTVGMIMYMVLVYYAWKYTYVYLKRYLTVAVLVLMAPLVAVSYAYNKVRTGKSVIFTTWFKEFFFNVILQSIHALIYLVFVQTALTISLNSISGMILTFVLFNFMTKAEGIFRKIFGVTSKGGAGSIDEVAQDKGIGEARDAILNAKKAVIGSKVAKVAVAHTKAAAKIATKPLKVGGAALFNNQMVSKAEKLEKETEKYKNLHPDEKIEDYADMKKALRQKRAQALSMGNMIKQLDAGAFSIGDLEEAVDELEEGQEITDSNGNITGYVTSDYISKKKKQIEDLKIITSNEQTKNELLETYEALHDKKGNLKKLRTYMSDKWQDIMDPTQYTEKDEETGEFKVIPKVRGRKNERGEIIESKKPFAKVVDSSTKRLANNLKWKNVSGLSKEENEALKSQLNLIKGELVGFAGLFVGLPMLVDNPAIGMPALAVGAASSYKVYKKNGTRKRVSNRCNKKIKGSFQVSGFEGKSSNTIAEGAKIMAEQEVEKMAIEKAKHENNMKNRIKAKYPKIEAGLTTMGSVASGITLGTMAVVAGAPAFVTGAAVAGGVTLTGAIMADKQSNAWLRYQSTLAAASKAAAKAQSNAEKDASSSDYMDSLADQYYKMEHEQASMDADRHAEEFGEKYSKVVDDMKKAIDEKTDAEILRDSNYEDQIQTETTNAGKVKISLESENKLIDNAIIECAQKSGIMNIEEFNVSNNMEGIQKALEKEMITKGIIQRNEKIDVVIEGLESKVKDRQAKINKNAVQDKMAGDAIVSVMQEKDITDPNQVSNEEVLQKFNQMYEQNLSAKSSQQSNDVLEILSAQKGDSSEAPKAVDLDSLKEQATSAIKAKKADFAAKAQQNVNEDASKAMRNALKKKKEIEIDTRILENEKELNSNISEMAINERGGLDSNNDGSSSVVNSDDVIKMLQLQTQLHKDKQKMETTLKKRIARQPKKMQQEFIEKVFTGDGSKRFNEEHDGSIKVDTSTQGLKSAVEAEIKANTSIDVIEILKKNK